MKSKKATSELQEFIHRSIGSFGIGQLFISCVCILPKISAAYFMIGIGFYAYTPDWWRISTSYNKTSGNVSIHKEFQKCPIGKNDTVEFDQTYVTIVTQWMLICSDKWIVTAIQTTQMAGVLVGATVFGHLGNVYGRKNVILASEAFQIISIFVQAFSYNWYMFIVTSFFMGIGLGGFFLVINPYLIEFVSGKWRTVLLAAPGFGTGIVLLGVTIYALPNWKYICILAAALKTPFFIMALFTPRSPRWLFTRGRIEEGKQIIASLAKKNKRPEPTFGDLDAILKEEFQNESDNKSYNYITLLKYPSTRKKTIFLGFTWFTQGFCYYALTLGVGNLAGSIAENNMLFGVTGISNAFLFYMATPCFGRKYTIIIFFFLTTLSSFGITLSYFVSTDRDQFKLITKVLALASRLFLSALWKANVLYSAESFPTVIRVVGLGVMYMMARTGGILAPQNQTLFDIAEHLPFTLNGILTLISGILLFFLPETYNMPLEDYIEEEKPKETDAIEIKTFDNLAYKDEK